MNADYDLLFDDLMSKLEIDRFSLEIEWVQQPSMMMQACEIENARRMAVTDLEQMLEKFDANLDLHIRNNPEVYGFDKKPTETGIKNTIVSSEKRQMIVKRLNSAQNDLLRAKSLVRSMDLVKLHGQEYFSKPSAELTPKETGTLRRNSLADKIKTKRNIKKEEGV